MRVLHSPVEIAGQAGLSVKGLRARGHTADSSFQDHPFGYSASNLPFAGRGTRHLLDRISLAARTAGRYDVYHYHFAQSYFPSFLNYPDARLNRRLGKRVVAEFWGSDVRLPSLELRRNQFFVNSYGESDRVSRMRMQRWAEITQGHVIFCDHSFDLHLAPHFPNIHVVGQRVDCDRFSPCFPDPEAGNPVLVHAPSEKAFKGTIHVQKAVERLKAKGLRFQYVEVHGMRQTEALREYRRADLIIDQLCGGSHGVFAAEAMSLGKPVICHVLPELVPTYPDGIPLISANPETIHGVLEEWLLSPQERWRVGTLSRCYAERVHDYRVVAARLEEVYRALPGASPL